MFGSYKVLRKSRSAILTSLFGLLITSKKYPCEPTVNEEEIGWNTRKEIA